MAHLLGGIGCVDPLALANWCAAQTPPVPTDRWRDKAGTFAAPLGREPGRGWALLRKTDLDALTLTSDLTLTFSGAETTRALYPVTLLNRECVTPGSATDPNAVYLCELVDRRYHLARVPIDKAYNVRSADGTVHLTSTKNGGTAWTWQEIVTDLATALGIGTLTLPFTPDATPNDLTYYGGWAWAALCDVLDRIACAVEYDPEANTFAAVRLGSADATATAAETALSGDRVWDGYCEDEVRGQLPEKVRVLFRRRPEPKFGTSPYYSVDVTLTATTGTVAGTYVQLHDDLAALGATGSPSNAAACSTRATERAADWRRKRLGYERTLLRVYRDFRDANDLIGPTVGRVAYDDRFEFRTVVRAAPDGLLEGWRPLGTGEEPAGAAPEAPFAVEPPANPSENSVPAFTVLGNAQNTPLYAVQTTDTFTQYAVPEVGDDPATSPVRQLVVENAGGTPSVTQYTLTNGTGGANGITETLTPTLYVVTAALDSATAYSGNLKSGGLIQYVVGNSGLTQGQLSAPTISGGNVTQFAVQHAIWNGAAISTGSDTVTYTGGNLTRTFDYQKTVWSAGNTVDFSAATVVGVLTGTGTTNAIPRWTTTAALGDSLLSQSGSVVSNTGFYDAVLGYQIGGTPGGSLASGSLNFAGGLYISGSIYTPGGTDVPLADGGTGASLSDPGADRVMFWDDSAGAVTWLEVGSGLSITGTTLATTGSGVADADYGDLTVSGGGATWTIDNDAVTYAKIQNVSATDKVLGRSTAGAGDVEEIACTAAGRALLDDADAAAQRTTLGLGTADAPQFAAINLGHASDTTLARSGAGDVTIEGNAVYRAGGTDVPVTDGGTGASTASGARTNLGLVAVASSGSAADLTTGTLATARLPTGDWIGANNGSVTGGYAITAASGTWVSTGIQFTCNATGTYDITCQIRGEMQPGAAGSHRITAKLANTSGPTDLTDTSGNATETLVVLSSQNGVLENATAVIVGTFDLTNSNTYAIYVQRVGTTFAASQIIDNTAGRTRMTYRRLY